MKLHNADLELSVLYSICESDSKVKSKLLANTGPKYFYNEYTNEAVKRVMALVKVSDEVPSFSELTSDPVLSETTRKKLRKYKGEPITEKKFRRRLRQLQQYYQVRELYFMSEGLNKSLQGEKVDVDKLLEETANKLTNARVRRDMKQEIHHIGKANNSADIVKRLLSKEKPNLVPTGFSPFDDVNGGIAYGGLFGLGGPAGGGKTSLAIQLAMNMSELGREDVAYVPLEMDEDETMERVLSNKSGVKLNRIKQRITTEKEDKKIKKAYKKHVNNLKADNTRFTIFSPSEDMTIEDILLTLKPYGHRVIIIDYLTLLKGVDSDSGGEKQWQKLSQVGRYCKIWAKANKTVLILLAQVSDEGALRYSQALKEHANNLWIWPANKETRENKVMRISQVKARNQSLFDFELGYDDELFQVFDINKTPIPKGDDAEKGAEDDYLASVDED